MPLVFRAFIRFVGRRHPHLWLLAVCVIYTQTVAAEQLSLLVNGKAIHFDAAEGQRVNEENWGGGFQYDFSERLSRWKPFLTVSGFKDSNNNPSYYAGGGTLRRFYITNDLNFDAGGIMFLMTRKYFRDGDPFFGVLPAFSVGTDNVSVNMTYVPKVDPRALPFVFFQLKVGFATRH